MIFRSRPPIPVPQDGAHLATGSLREERLVTVFLASFAVGTAVIPFAGVRHLQDWPVQVKVDRHRCHRKRDGNRAGECHKL